MKGQWKAAAAGAVLSVLVTCAVWASADCRHFSCTQAQMSPSGDLMDEDITLREAGKHLSGPR